MLVDEKIKIWKGEPFERAMANFYLGLIYYMRHDYDNARGAFENALFKLRDYADEARSRRTTTATQESNFVVATAHAGQMLAEDWVATTWPGELRSRDAASSGLQRCLADEERNARVEPAAGRRFRIRPAEGDGIRTARWSASAPPPDEVGLIPPPRVRWTGNTPVTSTASIEPTIDLLAMAQDRRWQDIDTIRTIKSTLGTAC